MALERQEPDATLRSPRGHPGTVSVRVDPSGIVLTVEPGESLFAAATRLGLTWPSVCGGVAECRTCYVAVTEGADHFLAVSDLEQRGIDAIAASARRHGGVLRLACQAVPTADAVVIRRGVRPRTS